MNVLRLQARQLTYNGTGITLANRTINVKLSDHLHINYTSYLYKMCTYKDACIKKKQKNIHTQKKPLLSQLVLPSSLYLRNTKLVPAFNTRVFTDITEYYPDM